MKVNKLAQTDFVGALCKYVGQPQPKVCAAHSSAVRHTSVPLIGFLFCILVKLYALQ